MLLALHSAYYNFCRLHFSDPLHSRNGSGYNKDSLESAGFARSLNNARI